MCKYLYGLVQSEYASRCFSPVRQLSFSFILFFYKITVVYATGRKCSFMIIFVMGISNIMDHSNQPHTKYVNKSSYFAYTHQLLNPAT